MALTVPGYVGLMTASPTKAALVSKRYKDGKASSGQISLVEDDKIRRAIRASMKAHELVLDVYAMDVRYGLVGQLFHQKRDFLWEQKRADQDLSRKMDWSSLIEHLEELGAKKRCNLYLRKRIEPEEAIKAGPEAAEHITAMFTELMPVYEAVVS